VRLYSNREAWLETLRQLLLNAASTRRPHERPVSRQTQIRLDPHQATALATAYHEGQTIKDLAQQYGVHRTTVSAILRRIKAPLRRQR
jgi:DNA-directed RNA polymerase specialized sigma24 family protein